MLPLYMKDGVQKIKATPVHQYIPQSYANAQQAVYMGKTLAEITNMTPFTRGQYVPVLVSNKGHSKARYSKRQPSLGDTHARRSQSRHMVNIPRNSKASFEGARTGAMVFGNPSYGIFHSRNEQPQQPQDEIVVGTEGWADYTWNKTTGVITYVQRGKTTVNTVQPGTTQHATITRNITNWAPAAGSATGGSASGSAAGGGAAGGATGGTPRKQDGSIDWTRLFEIAVGGAPAIISAAMPGAGTTTTGTDVTLTTTQGSAAPSYYNPTYGQSSVSPVLVVGVAAVAIGGLIFLTRSKSKPATVSNPRKRRKSSKRRRRGRK